MRYISLIVLISYSSIMYGQNPGDNVFNGNILIHEIRITLPYSAWHDTLSSQYELSQTTNSSVYAMGTFEFDGVIKDSVGFKFKGNSSYNNPGIKKSWKISTEEFINSNEIDDLNEFNLNNCFKDPSFLREKLTLDFLNYYGIPAPRCAYANVYVNNELFGFYTLVEEVDKKFLQTRFGNKGNNLYKGDPHGDLRWLGSSSAPYEMNYEKSTNENENIWNDLVWLIDNINNSSTSEYVDSLNSCFNTSSYLKSWASTLLFCNFDSYTGSGHNYFIYHNTETNKFEWINWDVNEAFGSFNVNNTITNMTTVPLDYIPVPQDSRPLNQKMKDEAIYWAQFQNFLCNALNDYFNSSHMFPIIDSLHNEIQTYVYADPNNLYSSQDFDLNVDQNVPVALGLKPFITQRNAFLTQQLNGFDCTALTGIEKQNETTCSVYPNPFQDQLNIQLPENATGIIILKLYNQLGEIVYENVCYGKRSLVLNTSQLVSGMYVLTASASETTTIIRILKQ